MTASGNPHRIGICVLLLAAALTGCGTTRSRMATEQLLMSDAVDHSIADIDFTPLGGRTVHLDTQYLKAIKGTAFVNAEYVISSLRQQMLAAGCLLMEKPEEAEFIVEARCGALGTDGNEITYGVPASTGLSNFASMLPNVPTVPVMPEISLARKEANRAAAKIGVFAYHRETRQPVWQSGVTVATSDAKDVWFFGAGPFQTGSIYRGTQLAGNPLDLPLINHSDDEPSDAPMVSYFDKMDFERQRRAAERRRKMTVDGIERLAELPELMPLTRSTTYPSAPPRRLPTPEDSAATDRMTDSGGTTAVPASESAPAAPDLESAPASSPAAPALESTSAPSPAANDGTADTSPQPLTDSESP